MFSGGSKGNIGKKRVNCCREASVNLSRYSEAVIYTNIVGDMGGSNGSIDGILLENINKEIQINFSLIITPIKDTPSISKTSTISKLENYIDEKQNLKMCHGFQKITWHTTFFNSDARKMEKSLRYRRRYVSHIYGSLKGF